jgi:hypothetical protein
VDRVVEPVALSLPAEEPTHMATDLFRHSRAAAPALVLATLLAPASAQHRIADLDLDCFAPTLSAHRDLDHDGLTDVAISGVPFHEFAVVSGRTGRMLRHHVPVDHRRILAEVDLDGDGEVEVLDTSSVAYSSGDVRVTPGRGSRVRTWRTPHPFGGVVVTVSDVDADRIRDVVIGDPQGETPGQGIRYGLVRVYSGADGRLLSAFGGTNIGSSFGLQIADAGDADGDGAGDALIGSQGTAGFYSLRDGRSIRRFGYDDFQALFGTALTMLTDVDGDGVRDVAVGAPQRFAEAPPGRVVAFSGATGAELWRAEGLPGQFFGTAVTACGDSDGDGGEDVAVGAPQMHPWGGLRSGPGFVQILSGCSGAVLGEVTGAAEANGFGSLVSAVGDVNGDSAVDVAVAHHAQLGFQDGIAVLSTRALLATGQRQVAGSGFAQTLRFHGGPEHGGHSYLVLGTLSGVRPGFEALGRTIPLNPDGYTSLLLGQQGQPWLRGMLGIVDPHGHALASLTVPLLASADLTWPTLTFDHVFVVFDPTTLALHAVSQPVPLVVAP